jgi:signal transduction histidine kinase
MTSERNPAGFEVALDGVALVNGLIGPVIAVNPSFARNMGRSREAIAATNLADLVHPSDLPAYRTGVARLVAGDVAEFDACLRFLGAGSSNIFSLTRVARAADQPGSDPLLYVTVERLIRQSDLDVSVGKSTRLKASSDAEMQHYKVEMEELVRLRTSELVRALDEAQGANRAKNAFLATVSHELRTPLNSIIGFSSMLLDGTTGDDPVERHKQLSIVVRSAELLLDPVKEILDLSSIEAGHVNLNLAPVKLRHLLEEQCDAASVQAEQRHLELRPALCDDDITVLADTGRLSQVVRNLLANAIKFTDAGHIAVSAKVLGNVARVVVHDTGIGIPRDRHKDLFVAFQRIPAVGSGQRTGTGLGLAISKRLIEAMGGTIGLDSEPGRGSTFWFVLPLTNGSSRDQAGAGMRQRGFASSICTSPICRSRNPPSQ